jgi:hypothetical protein
MSFARAGDPNSMITYTQIAELSERTALPLIEVIRALTETEGDSEAALARLHERDSGSIDVVDRKVAENLATTLVSEGLCFTCETRGAQLWRFRVPPESVVHVRRLGHIALRERPRVAQPAAAAQAGCG